MAHIGKIEHNKYFRKGDFFIVLITLTIVVDGQYNVPRVIYIHINMVTDVHDTRSDA